MRWSRITAALVGGTMLLAVGAAIFSSRQSAPSGGSMPTGGDERARPTHRSDYVGDAACVACHESKASYAHTAHAHTSGGATKESIKGSFAPGAHILRTANPDLYFAMEEKANGHFQTGVLRKPEQILTRAERFDLVVGSGRKGQSYLYWEGSKLFQLPVSYWTELGTWVNSPGYVDGTADFDRPIAPRCLECHASSFRAEPPPDNAYDPASLVPGISCEKCHGPGAEHAARFRRPIPPAARAEWAIVNPARLARERQIDACALCHAGIGHSITPPLSFQAGDVLARHLALPKNPPDQPLDVHASQVQLLARSRCFQATPTMSCSTCHDVHTVQRDVVGAAQSCRACHAVEHCGALPRLGRRIEGQCVECHMPLQDTAQIVTSSQGRRLQPKVRNHRIGIYPEVPLR